MTINKVVEGSTLTVELEGRLDTATAPRFDADVKSSLDGITELIIDMEQLAYLSSAGLRSILSLQKKMNKQGSMTICNVNDIVMEIFEVTGFVDILNID